MDENQITRRGSYISIMPGVTATEGMLGNLATLTFRKDGKVIGEFKGASLAFSDKLTGEDREYLCTLYENCLSGMSESKSGQKSGEVKTPRKARTSADNGRSGGRPKTEIRSFRDLQSLTSHEAGAIVYEDGTIWIGNWVGIDGIPRGLEPLGMIGLGEELTAKRVAAPLAATNAIRAHEREQGEKPSWSGFRAWRVNDVVVVINTNWN